MWIGTWGRPLSWVWLPGKNWSFSWVPFGETQPFIYHPGKTAGPCLYLAGPGAAQCLEPLSLGSGGREDGGGGQGETFPSHACIPSVTLLFFFCSRMTIPPVPTPVLFPWDPAPTEALTFFHPWDPGTRRAEFYPQWPSPASPATATRLSHCPPEALLSSLLSSSFH